MGQISAKALVYYPESDGMPMGETDFHIDAMMYLKSALQAFFNHQNDVYIACNIMFYYVEGDPKEVISPDVFIVFGVGKEKRRVYKLWEEAVPSVIFEITSKSTKKADLGSKYQLYESFGVQEYFIVDVEKDYLPMPLQAYQLVDGKY